jgi:arsenate reductase
MAMQSRVLFLCSQNTARSQMAEGFLESMAGDELEVLSAGTEPGEAVHPLAVAVMKEVGIDISDKTPKGLETYLGRELIQWVIIVCQRAADTCPRIWPGLLDGRRLVWAFEDPAAVEGTEEERLAAFRRVRDEIRSRLETWLREELPASS